MKMSLSGKRIVPWSLLGVAVIVNVALLINHNKAAEPKPAAPPPAAAAVAPPAEPPLPAGPQVEWQQANVRLNSTLERTFVDLLGRGLGAQVSQTFARLVVWDINLRTDLSPNDPIAVIYREVSDNEIDIAAARINVVKTGKVLRAYKFQAPGDAFASWWNQDGVEVPMQLNNSPVKDYQQVTSLVGDGRGHAGMDFKTPVGTPVVAPAGGKVLRSNWNWKYNGNCLEIEYADGTLAKFLHLNENKVKAGDSVEAGQLIALTGNTGHSTAPHLHYQLNQGAKLLDPVAYHGTTRRELAAAAMAQFKPVVEALDGQLTPKTAGL